MSVINMKTMKCCQFHSYLDWYNKGCVVLKFRIYRVWLQGKIRTSLLMAWLISGAKALLSMTKITPPQKTFPYHNWKRVTVGDWKELFSRGDQNNYTTHMLL